MNPYHFILVIYAKLYKTFKDCDDIAQNVVPCPCKDQSNFITLLKDVLCNVHIFRSETPLVVDVDFFLSYISMESAFILAGGTETTGIWNYI